MRRWPDTLPTPSFPGFGLTPIDQTIRSQFEVGTPLVRQITEADGDTVSLSWIFSDAEMLAFRRWFRDDAVSAAGDSDDLTGWTAVNVTLSAAETLGPGGCLPTKILPSTANDLHRLGKALPGLAADNLPVVFTASLAPFGITKARLRWIDRNGDAFQTDVDLVAGAFIGTPDFTAELVDRGHGTWRIIGQASTGAGSATPELRILALDASGAASFASDGAAFLTVCEVMARQNTRAGDTLFLRSGADGRALGAHGGSAWVQMPLALGGGFDWVDCRFMQTFTGRAGANLEWNVTAQVEVRYA